MISYVDFGEFAGKTGPNTSYKKPLTENELLRRLWGIRRENWCLIRGSVCKPVGGAIYWYKVLCTRPTYIVIGARGSVICPSVCPSGCPWAFFDFCIFIQ